MSRTVAVNRPAWEIRRRISLRPGGPRIAYRTYAHGYWRPLVVVILGRVLIGRRALRRLWAAHDRDTQSSPG